MSGHPAIRKDDLRRRPQPERQKLKRDRREAIKRLHSMIDYEIMMALRANGLYSHRTADVDILRTIRKMRESL